MNRLLLALTFITSGISAATSHAGVLTLADYRLNVDGVISQTASGVNLASFSTTTGLGTITATFTSPGSHYFGVFLDHEIVEATNTFFNEYGSVTGALAAGLSWEIDEPGFALVAPGDIFTNFGNSVLDNFNGVPSSTPDDVSMALAWNFTLLADEQATITMLVSRIAPLSGFYLQQTDPDSGDDIYFSTGLSIGAIPEPSSCLIFLGLMGASIRRHRPRQYK